MIPTPTLVLPIVAGAIDPLVDAIRSGVAYADDQQFDEDERDAHFWAHCARYRAKRSLAVASSDAHEWTLVEGIHNSGIRLRFGDIHVARVLRSLDGTTPHPGHSRARRNAYRQGSVAQPLALWSPEEDLPPLSMIIDWHLDIAGELAMYVGLPKTTWGFGRTPELYWRVPLAETADGFAGLSFNAGVDEELPLTIRIADEEEDLG